MFGLSHLRNGFMLLCTTALLWGNLSHASRLIHDDRGFELNWSVPAKRIVSLYPSLTESVCLLNACDRLVGVDRSSNWPEWVQSLPHLGGLWDTSLEEVVRLKPDVVLMSASNAKFTAKLEKLGLVVLVFQPQTWAQMNNTLREISKLVSPFEAAGVGPEQVELLLERLHADGLSLGAELAPWARGKSIYLQVGAGGYAASQSSYIGQLLTNLSLVNVVPASLGEFPQMGREWLLGQSPDFIVLTHQPDKPLKSTPGWRRMSAVIEGRICVLSQEQSDRLLRLGPRVVGGVRAVVECINKMRPF